MEKTDKIFLNSKQVSEYLLIPLRTVQHLTIQGKIKAIRVGRKWRYKRVDIDQYFNMGIDFSKEPIKRADDFVDRRLYPRINTNLNCQYSINLPPFKTINNIGILKNLSANGILVITKDSEIDICDPLDLEFMDIKTEGRVVRRNGNELGVKFRNMREQDMSKIIQYVG